MTSFFSKTIYFLMLYIIVLFSALFFILSYSKANIHLSFNKIQGTTFDIPFQFITHLGNGWFLVFVSLLLFLFNVRWSLLLALSGIFAGITVRIIKIKYFEYTLRPYYYFKEKGIELTTVEGVELLRYDTFPSGHSAGSFCLCFSLCLLFGKIKWLQILFGVLAILSAFSRVYLSQHFLVDSITGSLIAMVYVLVSYFLLEKLKYQWLNKSFIPFHNEN